MSEPAPQCTIHSEPLEALEGDVIVAVVRSGPEGRPVTVPPAVAKLVRADAGSLISRAVDALTWLETQGARAPRVLFVHAGPRATASGRDLAGFNGSASPAQRASHRRQELRVLGAVVERACAQAEVQRVIVAGTSRDEEALCLVEGMLLRGHSPQAWRDEPPSPALRSIAVAVEPGRRAAVQALWRPIGIAARATNAARTLADLPSNLGTPDAIAARVREMARGRGLSMRVLGRDEAIALGMGLFEGVDRGAAHPGCVVVLEHRKAEAAALPTLALAGKGLCHDTGGYNLKTVGELHTLTYDKCGAAAVFGAMMGIADLDLDLHVIAACPLAENVVDGDAYKPGDILTAYDGSTVYIENTDAEGRLVLADTLAWLDESEPDLLVDVATLTGSAHLALGEPFGALFTNDDEARKLLEAAARRSGDLLWPMPIHEIHDRELAHPRADLKNLGVRGGGACSAAAFLRHFVHHARWAHLDIAGKAHTEFARDTYGPGATGFGCRLLIALARRFADEWEVV